MFRTLSILRFKTKRKNKNPGPFGPRQSASGTSSCMRILELFRLDGMRDVHKKVGAEDQHLIFQTFLYWTLLVFDRPNILHIMHKASDHTKLIKLKIFKIHLLTLQKLCVFHFYPEKIILAFIHREVCLLFLRNYPGTL